MLTEDFLSYSAKFRFTATLPQSLPCLKGGGPAYAGGGIFSYSHRANARICGAIFISINELNSNLPHQQPNNQPFVGASIARPWLPCLKGAVKRKLD